MREDLYQIVVNSKLLRDLRCLTKYNYSVIVKRKGLLLLQIVNLQRLCTCVLVCQIEIDYL